MLHLLVCFLIFAVIISSTPPPKIANIPYCYGEYAQLTDFMMSTGSGPFPAVTVIKLCWKEFGLEIFFDAYNDMHTQNTKTQCNADLYNQEVVEFFITAGAVDPTLYTEIEITPNELLFVATIQKPLDSWKNSSKTYYPSDCKDPVGCDCGRVRKASGVNFSTAIDPHRNMWRGSMSVPWSTMNWHSQGIPTVLRGNFYRILMKEDMEGKDCPTIPSGETGPCIYGAWTPTYQDPPSFHWAHYFATFNIQKRVTKKKVKNIMSSPRF